MIFNICLSYHDNDWTTLSWVRQQFNEHRKHLNAKDPRFLPPPKLIGHKGTPRRCAARPREQRDRPQ